MPPSSVPAAVRKRDSTRLERVQTRRRATGRVDRHRGRVGVCAGGGEVHGRRECAARWTHPRLRDLVAAVEAPPRDRDITAIVARHARGVRVLGGVGERRRGPRGRERAAGCPRRRLDDVLRAVAPRPHRDDGAVGADRDVRIVLRGATGVREVHRRPKAAARRAHRGLDHRRRGERMRPDDDGVALRVDRDLGLRAEEAEDVARLRGSQRLHRTEGATGRTDRRLHLLGRAVRARPRGNRLARGRDRHVHRRDPWLAAQEATAHAAAR